MRILLLGAHGQLGREIQARVPQHVELVTGDLPGVDISQEQSVLQAVKTAAPAVVINAAAYTAVDRAETDRDAAFRVNRDGAENLAAACREARCRLIHVSTDYVFGHGFQQPITESAAAEPLNVYGASKLAGEEAIRRVLPEHSLIVRTSSLHGRYGANFVQTMVELLSSRPEVRVVADQIMSPTWAGWLGEVLLRLAEHAEWRGVVHASGSGAVSWFDFAQAILEEAAPVLPASARLLPIAAAEYPRPARRAPYSVLCTDKLTGWLGSPPIGWREGLQRHLSEMGLCAAERRGALN